MKKQHLWGIFFSFICLISQAQHNYMPLSLFLDTNNESYTKRRYSKCIGPITRELLLTLHDNKIPVIASCDLLHAIIKRKNIFIKNTKTIQTNEYLFANNRLPYQTDHFKDNASCYFVPLATWNILAIYTPSMGKQEAIYLLLPQRLTRFAHHLQNLYHDNNYMQLLTYQDVEQQVYGNPNTVPEVNLKALTRSMKKIAHAHSLFNDTAPFMIYLTGHGSYPKLKKKSEPSYIAELSDQQFRKLLEFCNTKIKTIFFYYDSCYSGGPQLSIPYQGLDLSYPVISKISDCTTSPGIAPNALTIQSTPPNIISSIDHDRFFFLINQWLNEGKICSLIDAFPHITSNANNNIVLRLAHQTHFEPFALGSDLYIPNAQRCKTDKMECIQHSYKYSQLFLPSETVMMPIYMHVPQLRTTSVDSQAFHLIDELHILEEQSDYFNTLQNFFFHKANLQLATSLGCFIRKLYFHYKSDAKPLLLINTLMINHHLTKTTQKQCIIFKQNGQYYDTPLTKEQKISKSTSFPISSKNAIRFILRYFAFFSKNQPITSTCYKALKEKKNTANTLRKVWALVKSSANH